MYAKFNLYFAVYVFLLLILTGCSSVSVESPSNEQQRRYDETVTIEVGTIMPKGKP